MDKNELQLIIKENGNNLCFDCGSPQPKWASVSNGVLICLNCSGMHRGLGVNISYVKSLYLDSW